MVASQPVVVSTTASAQTQSADHAAAYLAMRLHDAVDTRPPVPTRTAPAPRPASLPSLQPLDQDVRAALARVNDAPALENLVRSSSFTRLSQLSRRRVLRAVSDDAQVVALTEILTALERAPIDPRAMRLFLEVLEGHRDLPAVRHVLHALATSGTLAALSPVRRRVVLQYASAPRPSRASQAAHVETLEQWWSARCADLLAWIHAPRRPEAADEDLQVFLHRPAQPVFTMTSDAQPGVFILCVGEPSGQQSLAWVRFIALTPARALHVVLRSPVRLIQEGWRGQAKNAVCEYRFTRWVLSRGEEKQLIRWVEDNHRVTRGPETETVRQQGASVPESLLQFDVRVPRMLEILVAHRAPAETSTGIMHRGRIRGAKPSVSAAA